MAEFLTTKKILYHIEDIIEKAKKKLVIVSAYLKISPDYQVRLRDASRRGVKTILIHGKTELSNEEIAFLATIDNLELYFFEHLPAKTYFNEETMVITSMNLYDFSAKNIEVGVLVKRTADRDLFDKCANEMASVQQSADRIFLRREKRFKKQPAFADNRKTFSSSNGFHNRTNHSQNDDGFCIRCGNSIEYDPARPYCTNFFFSWNQYQNHDWVESNCHGCGKQNQSTMSRPECTSCYYN